MRTFASRFLLVGLVVAVLVFVINRAGDPGGALAVIDGVRAEAQPEHEAFRVDAPVRVTIEAAGSFEGGEADTALAAHGWLVHRETGEVAWQMRPARRPDRGTFVLMRDTIRLAPGTYDAYFAGLGVPEARTVRRGTTFRERVSDALRGGGKGWVGDADRWRLLVQLAPGEDRESAEEISDDIPEPDHLVWGSGPARSDELYEVALRATAPVQIRLDALFEAVGDTPADSAYLVSVDGDTLWTARPEASRHAGGSPRNRRQTDTLSLEPGRYRAVYRADDSHAYRDWESNPPWEPWRWGLRIAPADSASRAGAIAPEDPLRDLPRLVDLSCVSEEDARREIPFETASSLEVTIVAVGEYTNGDWYDYAEIVRDGSTVWDMRDAPRKPAGGGRKNVRTDETITLDPGRYTLRYVTDGSHQCGDYNTDDPDIPDLWGVVLLSADGEEGGERIRVMDELGRIPQDALASIVGLGDDEEESQTFRLAEATDVCVLALGEISEDSRYDYGSITGPTSWTQNLANSFEAGGAYRNRMSIAYLTLQPGAYTVRFRSDGSHSPESWLSGGGPDHPEHWGIQVWRAPESAREMPDPRSGCVPSGIAVPAGEIPPPPPASSSSLPSPDPPFQGAGGSRPELVGGLAELQQRLEYPDEAREAGIEGTVYVQLEVEADGNVEDVECLSTPSPALCEAAVAAIEASEFRPGTRGGEAVDLVYRVPVSFRLQ